MGNLSRGVSPSLRGNIRFGLEVECTFFETKKAMMEMCLWKAPGPGRMGAAVHKSIQGAFRGDEIPEEATEALLVLVPKETKPISIKSFMPISLCTVSVKLVTKFIANRLKMFLKDIVSPNQTSFIPGRNNTSNVIICQEVIPDATIY